MFYRSRKTLPIYDAIWLDVVISDDIEKLNKEFNCNSDNWFACVFRHHFKLKKKDDRIKKSVVVVLNPNNIYGNITPAIIVHESIHIKNIVFDQIGYSCKRNNDEAEAYLTEFIFNVVSAFYEQSLKKEKNSKKNKNGKRK